MRRGTQDNPGKDQVGRNDEQLSLKAGLSLAYTNHSVRTTFITKMTIKKVPGHVIARPSGYRNLSNLQAYHQPPESNKHRTASLVDQDVVEDVGQLLETATPEDLAQLETGSKRTNNVLLSGNFTGASINRTIAK